MTRELIKIQWNSKGEAAKPLTLTLSAGKGYLITGSQNESNCFLLRTLGGIHYPENGSVWFQGGDLYEGPETEIKQLKKKMAYVFAEGALISNLDIRENLLLPVYFHNPQAQIDEFLERLKQDFCFFNIPDILDLRPAQVAVEIRKKLNFIRASILNPQVIFLEKPMFNLDYSDRLKVLEYLEKWRHQGITLIMVSHSPGLIEKLVDQVIVWEKGARLELINKNSAENRDTLSVFYDNGKDQTNYAQLTPEEYSFFIQDGEILLDYTYAEEETESAEPESETEATKQKPADSGWKKKDKTF